MPTRNEQAANIIHSQGAEAALNFIRSSMRKRNAHSLSATVALVKGEYYKKYGQPPGYVEAVTDLQTAVDATPQEEHLRARQLLAMNPSERRIAIRKQAKTTVNFSSDPRVLRAYRRLEGVAEWPKLKEFRMSPEELAECVTTKKQRLLESQTKSAAGGQRQVIPDGDALVTWCEDVFHAFNNTIRPSPIVDDDEPRLSHLCLQDLEDKVTVALLLTLGRRTYEIRSGMSTFEPVPDNKYGVYFSGQAKQGGMLGDSMRGAFCVQTLLPYTLWYPSYLILFQNRYGARSRAMVQADQAHQLQREITVSSQRLSRIIYHDLCRCKARLTPHQLRDVYVVIGHHRFCHGPYADKLVYGGYMLGHVDSREALAYVGVHVSGLNETRPQGRVTVDYLNRTCVSPAKEEQPSGVDRDI